MHKVLLLGSQHGNELLGEMLYKYIGQQRTELLPHVKYLTGNLRAHKQNVRYIERDMNRSYTGGRKTYEERRASSVLRYIGNHQFDLVLDLHTTSVEQPPCLITASPNQRFIRFCSIDKIVHMRHEIVATSLIGVCPQAISVEISRHQIDQQLLTSLCNDIARYVADAPLHKSRMVYEVDDLLHKDEMWEVRVATLPNFELSEHGFYPVLVGENSYKKQTNYLGFKAYNVYKITL